MESIFTDKNKQPDDDNLKESLGNSFQLWQLLKDYTFLKYPKGLEEWNCSKYGWSFRIKEKKRTIIYFLPRDRFFKVAFVFGEKATNLIMNSEISNVIKKELESSKVYAEGRGIRIDIRDTSIIKDIKELIDIKLAN
jgi:hypothetical protein